MSGEFWNERFSDAGYLYGEAPNAFLSHRHTLIPKDAKVLVLGDGEGRNGVFLAGKRCHVTSVDASSVGLEKTQVLAKKKGVTIETIHGVLPDVEIEKGVWDAVVLIFLHLAEPVRQQVHQLAIDALKPGGMILLEAFTPAQIGLPSGGPKDAAYLYTAEILHQDFATIDIEALAELDIILDEGVGHRGPAKVVRMIASKPE